MAEFAGYLRTDKRTLTNTEAKSLVSVSRQKLEAGKRHRSSEREQVWAQSERQYAGDHWFGNAGPEADYVQVDMSFSTVNTITPYVTGHEPNFIVEPLGQNATALNARIQAALLNTLWRENGMAAQVGIEDVTVDSLIYGDGFPYIGWTIRERRDGDRVIKFAELWLARIDPWDVWIDPQANGIHDARWVARRMFQTRDEIESNPFYRNTDEENISYAGEIARSDNRRKSEIHDPNLNDGSEMAELYEFFDLVKMKRIIFASGELPLLIADDIGGSPIVQMSNYRIPGTPWHMGELERVWNLQQELNLTRTQMATHRRRAAAKFVARKGALDSVAKGTLSSQEVLAVAEIDYDGPLQDVILPLAIPALTADVYAMSDVIRNDIYEITGVNEYLRGASPSIRRTATEATIIEGASNVKTAAKLRMVERSIGQAGRIMLQIAKDVYPLTDVEEASFLLTGKDAELVGREFQAQQVQELTTQGADPEAIDQVLAARPSDFNQELTPVPEVFEGRYRVSVETSSTELRNPVLREQRAREMFITLAQTYPILSEAGVAINLKRLLEIWLEAANVDDIDAIFEAPQDQQLQQLLATLGPLAAGGGPSGAQPLPGAPNQNAIGAPQDLPDEANSGIQPPG